MEQEDFNTFLTDAYLVENNPFPVEDILSSNSPRTVIHAPLFGPFHAVWMFFPRSRAAPLLLVVPLL